MQKSDLHQNQFEFNLAGILITLILIELFLLCKKVIGT